MSKRDIHPIKEEIVSLMRLFQEKEGRFPTRWDRVVWGKKADGEWVKLPKTWPGLNQTLLFLPGSSSLSELQAERGLLDNWTEDKIKHWCVLFYEKEGRYPSVNDKVIWEKNRAGEWMERGGTWHVVHEALKFGRHGLPGGSSLAQFKSEHGLQDEWTEAKVLRLIHLFHEKTGKWPSIHDETVWDRNDKGWVKTRMKWDAVNYALKVGRGELPGGSSLAEFKKQHGLYDLVENEDMAPPAYPQRRHPVYRPELAAQ